MPRNAEYIRVVGHNISVLRKRKGWTAKQLSEYCHMDRCAITHIEGGKVNTTMRTLIRICDALGVDLRHLLDEDLE